MSEIRSSVSKPWLAMVGWFVLTEALMIASAFAWVWIYSTMIHTGGDEAFYQAYARSASPVVAVVVAFPVFFLMGRFMRRYRDGARFAAFAVVAANLVLDFVVVATLADALMYNLVFSLGAAAAKVAGAHVATRGA